MRNTQSLVARQRSESIVQKPNRALKCSRVVGLAVADRIERRFGDIDKLFLLDTFDIASFADPGAPGSAAKHVEP
jgi:hypothetical protein